MSTSSDLPEFLRLIVGEPLVEIRIIQAGSRNNSTVGRGFFKDFGEAAKFAMQEPFREHHVYFGVCPRKEESGKKEAVASCHTVWVDIDKNPAPEIASVLPPSATVFTGHGYHLYWRLDHPITVRDSVEAALRQLQIFTDGDKVCDISRMMRVPGTYNVKDTPPVKCELIEVLPTTYELTDFTAIRRVDSPTLGLVLSGDLDGLPTRSERDWKILVHLVKAGLSDLAIRQMFRHHACGDVYREEGEHYLTFSLEKARGVVKESPSSSGFGFTTNEGVGYFKQTAAGDARLSTFTLKPTAILIDDANQEMFQADVIHQGKVAKNKVFPRQCFLSVSTFTKYLESVDWQWLGTDRDVRVLLAVLSETARAQKLQRQNFVRSVGRHGDLWVGSNIVFDKDNQWDPAEAPLVFVPQHTDYVGTNYHFDDKSYRQHLQELVNVLPKLNSPEVIWPVIGWYAATAFKDTLMEHSIRFPILNIFGSRGSGKTTLVQEVFLPLSGVESPKVHDCNTTHFVMMCLLGASRGVPLALAEFRQSSLSQAQYSMILRTVLLSYDAGRDSRGRADQTIVEYPLTAPFSIDGEDPLPDQAAKERILAVHMSPNTIEPGSAAANALTDLQGMDLSFFAGPYLRWSLAQDIVPLWNSASTEIDLCFPGHLPHRVRRNITTAYLGLLALQKLCKSHSISLTIPSGEIMRDSLHHIVSEQGVSKVMADVFVEDLVNDYAFNGATNFPARMDDGDTQILWFHPKSAYSWWCQQRARERQPVLDYTSIRNQLKERAGGAVGAYVVDFGEIRYVWHGVWRCAGIDLLAARGTGLEIPETIDKREYYGDEYGKSPGTTAEGTE